MKNKFLFLFLILSSLNCFSQEHLINGTVYSAETRKPVTKVKVILHLPDSKTMEFTTDSTGTYTFKAAGPGKFYITAEKCRTGECYLNKKFVIDSSALKNNNSIYCDLTLMPVKQERSTPIILFKKNSSFPDSCIFCSNGPVDSACIFISQTLLLNDNLIFSIDGYAEKDEKNPEKLSLDRALAVKKILLKYIPDEKRIMVKSFGTKPADNHRPNNRIVNFSPSKI